MSPRVSEFHKEQRRQEIIEAAARVFAAKGYEHAAMQDVVEASGMSRGGVYLYFSSKEQLFRALLDRIDSERAAALQALAASESGAWEAIERLLDGLRGDPEGLATAIYEYFLAGTREAERLPYLRDRFETICQAIQALMNLGIEQDEFRPRLEPRAIAEAFLAFTDGLVMHGLFLEPEPARRAAQIVALRLFLVAALAPVRA